MFPSFSSITFACFWWAGYNNADPNQICKSVKDIWQSGLRHLAVCAHNAQGHKKQKKKKEFGGEWVSCGNGVSQDSEVQEWLLRTDQDNSFKSGCKSLGSWITQEWWEKPVSLQALQDLGRLVCDSRQKRLPITAAGAGVLALQCWTWHCVFLVCKKRTQKKAFGLSDWVCSEPELISLFIFFPNWGDFFFLVV